MAALLLAHGADVNAKDNGGQTPLHLAAYEGYALQMSGRTVSVATGSSPNAVVELLLANKAEVNAKNNNGHTPLIEAAGTGKTGVAKLLLVSKADVNAKDNDGWTALHWAANKGHPDVVKMLLLYRADVNAKDNDGNTPLDQAKNGNDSNEQGRKDWAVYKDFEQVMKLLRHPPPPSPVILMAVSQFVSRRYISLLGTIGVIVILGFFIYFRSESGARALNWIQLHLPFVGKKYDNAPCSENTKGSSVLPQPPSIQARPPAPPQPTPPQGQLGAASNLPASFHKMLLKEIPALLFSKDRKHASTSSQPETENVHKGKAESTSFACPTCNNEWPSNYCPQCGRTIAQTEKDKTA